ncbi:MFS transporter [Rummeliibacillus sp. POC4]|uniref:MFS transporter n=1 Tax=Rummeliibacillus sp. POC4 TaxID=2305899 RepID=UPI00210181C9|nr:MFS transporter [Rummeliibacillus sp. POC4]
MLLSTVTGNLGSGILSFLIGLLILKNTGSALSFGISQVIGPIVALLLLPLTGSVVDKFNKKTIIIYAQLLSIFSLTGYAVIIHFQDFENLIYTYLLLIFLKISDQFLTTAFTSSFINMVIDEHIQKLKSLQQILNALIMILAPILGVILYDSLSLFYLIILEIVLECLTIFIVISINFKFSTPANDEREENSSSKSIYQLFKEGLSFILESKKLVFTLFFSMLTNFMFGAVNVGIPFIQINILHFSNNIYGITEAIFALGMIISGIVLSASKDIQYPLFNSWRMIGVIGALFIMLGILLGIQFEQLYFIIIISLFNLLIGIAITLINVPFTVWLTKEIPSHYQGRVFNILSTGAQLLSPLGILAFSGLFDWYDSFMIFIITGISILFITFIYPVIFKIRLKDNELLNNH